MEDFQCFYDFIKRTINANMLKYFAGSSIDRNSDIAEYLMMLVLDLSQ